MKPKNKSAVALGRLGGLKKSTAKTEANKQKALNRWAKVRTEQIAKGSMVRLVNFHKDRRLTRVLSMHPSGTAVVLTEARGGYFHWNIGDIELEPRVERHARLAKEAIGF